MESTKFLPFDTKGLKIGILGGSFNPPHAGHLSISKAAIDLLKLDYVVWLVSPQNPLKEKNDFLTFDERVGAANALINNEKRILVNDYESRLTPPFYTYKTLLQIKKDCSDAKLFWLMGADNMIQFPKWQNWQEIMSLVTLVIFDRDDYMQEALNGEVAKIYKKSTIVDQTCDLEEGLDWIYLKIPKVDISSTQIREGKIV